MAQDWVPLRITHIRPEPPSWASDHGLDGVWEIAMQIGIGFAVGIAAVVVNAIPTIKY